LVRSPSIISNRARACSPATGVAKALSIKATTAPRAGYDGLHDLPAIEQSLALKCDRKPEQNVHHAARKGAEIGEVDGDAVHEDVRSAEPLRIALLRAPTRALPLFAKRRATLDASTAEIGPTLKV
jgi:hypothetical protein